MLYCSSRAKIVKGSEKSKKIVKYSLILCLYSTVLPRLQKQLGHYISGYRKPSEKTVRNIEDRIQEFGKQLCAVHFA